MEKIVRVLENRVEVTPVKEVQDVNRITVRIYDIQKMEVYDRVRLNRERNELQVKNRRLNKIDIQAEKKKLEDDLQVKKIQIKELLNRLSLIENELTKK